MCRYNSVATNTTTMIKVTTTYKSFIDMYQHCPFVAEHKHSVIGQGLVNTYTIDRVGTGQNIYTFNLVSGDGKTCRLVTSDKRISGWTTGYHDQDDSDLDYNNDTLFKAAGIDNYGTDVHIVYCEGSVTVRYAGAKLIFTLDNVTVHVPDDTLTPLECTVANCNRYPYPLPVEESKPVVTTDLSYWVVPIDKYLDK